MRYKLLPAKAEKSVKMTGTNFSAKRRNQQSKNTPKDEEKGLKMKQTHRVFKQKSKCDTSKNAERN